MGAGFWMGILEGQNEADQKQRDEAIAQNKEQKAMLMNQLNILAERADLGALQTLLDKGREITALDPYDVKKFERAYEKAAQFPSTYIAQGQVVPPKKGPSFQVNAAYDLRGSAPGVPSADLEAIVMGGAANPPSGPTTVKLPDRDVRYEAGPVELPIIPDRQREQLREDFAKLNAANTAFADWQRRQDVLHQQDMEKLGATPGTARRMTQAQLNDLADRYNQPEFSGMPEGQYYVSLTKDNKRIAQAIPTTASSGSTYKTWTPNPLSTTGYDLVQLDNMGNEVARTPNMQPPASIAGSVTQGYMTIQSGDQQYLVPVDTYRKTLNGGGTVQDAINAGQAPSAGTTLPAAAPPSMSSSASTQPKQTTNTGFEGLSSSGRPIVTADRKWTADEVGEKAKMDTFLRIADETMKLMADNAKYLGPFISWWSGQAQKYPEIETALTEFGYPDSASSNVTQMYERLNYLNNSLIYLLSGKQINATEFERLAKQMPSEKMQPGPAITRLQDAIKILADIQSGKFKEPWKGWTPYAIKAVQDARARGVRNLPSDEEMYSDLATPSPLKPPVPPNAVRIRDKKTGKTGTFMGSTSDVDTEKYEIIQ